jgi:hypothetical protein
MAAIQYKTEWVYFEGNKFYNFPPGFFLVRVDEEGWQNGPAICGFKFKDKA